MAETNSKSSPQLSVKSLSINPLCPSSLQKIVAELVGTYILVFLGCGAALVDKVQGLPAAGVPAVFGGALIIIIYALGHVSGAHINPAVTIAFAASRQFPWKHVPMYILAQLLGSMLASLTLKALFHEHDDIQVTMTQYSDGVTHLEALAWEFICTSILMLVISAVATDLRASKDFAGIAIGVAVFAEAMVAGPITGASMNPARSIGPAVVSGVIKNQWVFVVAPILGALFASMLYSVLRVEEPPHETAKTVDNEEVSFHR
jgi:aquaporin NIP